MKKLMAVLLAMMLLLGSVGAIAESSYNMTWNSGVDPATWNGNQWSGTAGGWIWDLGTDAMFIFARLSDNVYPRMATGITHDGNVTTVTLRQGAKYTDGVEITSKDVWGWFQLHRQSVTRYLTSVDIVDDYTLNFVFAEPAPFNQMREWLLANSGRNVGMPYHIYHEFIDKAAELWANAPAAPEGTSDYFQKDSSDEAFAAAWTENWNALAAFVPEQGFVASGPYVLDGEFTESDMRLKKNEMYWDAENIKFDVITNKNTTGEQGIAMLKSADSDCYPGSLPVDVAEAVLTSNEDIVFYPTVDPACHGLYFNQKSENSPMSDVNFRRAINYVVDKTPIREIGNYYGQEFDYSCTGIPPLFLTKYVSEEVLNSMTLYTTDLDKAAQVMTDAGYVKNDGVWCYADGTPIKVVIGVNGGWQPAAVVANVNNMVGEQLNAFGITTEVLVVESSMFTERRNNNEFCMVFDWIDVSWSFSDPYFTLSDLYNNSGYVAHMGVPTDEITGEPIYAGMIFDMDGNELDPIAMLKQMPYIYDSAERLAMAEKLIYAANEACLGINLYQNCTGIWENRATTTGLPYQDQISDTVNADGIPRLMPVPEIDDPYFANIVNLNWGFSGYMKLMDLGPAEGNE